MEPCLTGVAKVLKVMGQHLNIKTQVGAIFSTQYSVVEILMCAVIHLTVATSGPD